MAPWSRWDPVLPGTQQLPARSEFVRSDNDPGPLPANDEDIAFANVTQLSRWIEGRKLTSERLTNIYLARLEKYNPTLRCVITLTKDHALQQAKQADQEIAAGKYRGPLHGIPWGAKDLLDTAGIPTTYGAEPFKDRTAGKKRRGRTAFERCRRGAGGQAQPGCAGTQRHLVRRADDESVEPRRRLVGIERRPGRGDGRRTGRHSPWAARPAAASSVRPCVAASPDLRPTYGRVARTGAMTLCWSLDKLGPMARSVEDTILVLNTISGPDAGDVNSVPSKLDFNAGASVKDLRVGYFPKWMKEAPATDVDRMALETVSKVGMVPVEVSLPDWPYDSLDLILFAEAAASFEEITLNDKLSELKMQVPDAWPNTFRQSRFLSAVDLRAERPLPPHGGERDGPHHVAGRSAAGAVACATRC